MSLVLSKIYYLLIYSDNVKTRKDNVIGIMEMRTNLTEKKYDYPTYSQLGNIYPGDYYEALP